ncbi:GNAT family N-acetyltransferase [Gammaproteobacteria bacterium]|nr:GNAT family N-acetyltransferase [Gammaproteobacteria bacterium]
MTHSPAPTWTIDTDPLSDDSIIALLQRHLTLMRSQSPACSVHALDLDALRAPNIDFWSARQGANHAVGCIALKRINAVHGEVKSMHVIDSERGSGLANALLQTLLVKAKAHGLQRLSLETGSQPGFAAARRFYARHGFAPCAPFDTYVPDPNSAFMTRTL